MRLIGQLLILIGIFCSVWFMALGGAGSRGKIDNLSPPLKWFIKTFDIGGGIVLCAILVFIGAIFWALHRARRADQMAKSKYVTEDRRSLFWYIGRVINILQDFSPYR